MRIVFMGTPEFAVASLRKIHESDHDVVGVITATDKPAGRGKKLRASAVKQYALEHQIPVLQPEKLRNPEFLEALKALNADLFVVVAFRMLPEVVWDMPLLGTINLHGSLLPQYRGAAPIHWAVINGEKETGVSTFFIDKEIDTGRVIQRASLEIGPNESTGSVHDRMMVFGADVLLDTINLIANGKAESITQEELVRNLGELRHAPKISKADAEINWNQTAAEVHNRIRGMSPFPGAWTMLNGSVLKMFKAIPQPVMDLPAGEIRVQNDHLVVGCGDGCIELQEVQLQGKRRMSVDDFLRGNTIETGTMLG